MAVLAWVRENLGGYFFCVYLSFALAFRPLLGSGAGVVRRWWFRLVREDFGGYPFCVYLLLLLHPFLSWGQVLELCGDSVGPLLLGREEKEAIFCLQGVAEAGPLPKREYRMEVMSDMDGMIRGKRRKE